MTIIIDLPTEIATTLEARAAAKGQDVASLVREMVVEGVQDEGPVQKPNPQQSFRTRLQKVIDLLPQPSSTVDDSRESIYAGRGE